MANKKTPYKKNPEAVWMEEKLREILVNESRAAGCISHPKKGFSVSEISRRLIKGRILEMRKYIKNTALDVDWSEAI
ncbi:MAG: hypothetical protein PHS33_08835 [Candidatus Omnitrophica bacterium]|nr:hypothetical protein [Candidatus Omnitrophota bacterium]